jgi:hypothetical protein
VAEELTPIERGGVAVDDRHVVEPAGDLLECREQPPVELDRENDGARVGESQREGSQPRPDLHDPLPRSHDREGGDPAGEVRIGQEVLAQGLGRADPVSLGEVAQRGPAEARALRAAVPATS